MNVVVVASGNRHKVGELSQWLGQAAPELAVFSMTDFGAPPEISEDADTFAGNAALKATGIASWLRMAPGGARADVAAGWVLADDSGLGVDALDGAPGVYSARFAGMGASDADNNRKLVAELVARDRQWSAAGYICVLALCTVADRPWRAEEWQCVASCDGVELSADGRCLLVAGECRGEVGVAARGLGGFGYDPHFWIDSRSQTFAEIARETKAQRSHRGQALSRLLQVVSRLRSHADAAPTP